jgi:8-oxo-dGTP pyrophosphatase MutT (NUDIX family)
VPSPEFIIPAERLPEGFAETLDVAKDNPVPAKPAATVVLLRDGSAGMEALLLKRHRSSGFVPGAYVFPGGRTDEADAAVELLDYATRLPTVEVDRHFWFAAVREVFEESGVLLARDRQHEWAPDTTTSETMEQWRLKLMAEEATLVDVLRENNYCIQFENLVYFAHWITPLAEPRRYDTRFFAAVLPHGRQARPDPREMTDAIWLTPKAALDRFHAGKLPMVFPTVRTLQQLSDYATTADALTSLRARDVAPILPRLVRTTEGVGIVIDPK